MSVEPERSGAETDNLAVAVHRGTDGALEALIALFERPLYGYATAVLQNTADAQEVVQDAMMRAHRALTRRYDEARCATLALRPWMFRTVRNLCINRRRSRMRASEEPLEAMTERGLEPFTTGHENDIERREDLDTLRGALQELPLASRELIILRFIEEMSYSEISKTVGISEAALRGKVFRALRQLRKALEEKGLRHAM